MLNCQVESICQCHELLLFQLEKIDSSCYQPLVSLAGFTGAGISETALAKHKLMVLEIHTASHAGTWVRAAVGSAHWDEVVWTVTWKT